MALYLTEALISKGNLQEAMNVLRTENEEEKLMQAGTFENILTYLPENNPLPISAIIHLNMATLNFLTDNIDDARTSIENAIA